MKRERLRDPPAPTDKNMAELAGVSTRRLEQRSAIPQRLGLPPLFPGGRVTGAVYPMTKRRGSDTTALKDSGAVQGDSTRGGKRRWESGDLHSQSHLSNKKPTQKRPQNGNRHRLRFYGLQVTCSFRSRPMSKPCCP